MEPKHNRRLVPLAKTLRRAMTPEERHLWYDYLRGHPARFSRQKVLGQYIADFYSARARLVVEVDGGQHYEQEAARADGRRTAFLQQYGLQVLRIPNNAVRRNFPGVCAAIDAAVAQRMTGDWNKEDK